MDHDKVCHLHEVTFFVESVDSLEEQAFVGFNDFDKGLTFSRLVDNNNEDAPNLTCFDIGCVSMGPPPKAGTSLWLTVGNKGRSSEGQRVASHLERVCLHEDSKAVPGPSHLHEEKSASRRLRWCVLTSKDQKQEGVRSSLRWLSR